jgi:hypothetical protein
MDNTTQRVDVESYSSSSDIEALRMENLKLRNMIKSERQMYEEKYFEKADTSSSLVELKEKIELLELENRNLKQGTNNTESHINSQKRIEELEKQILELTQKSSDGKRERDVKR